MNIVSVIPFSKGILKSELSYFTAKDVAIGDIVTVPLRKKNIEALVTKVESVSDAKGSIKSEDFNLKKVVSVKGKSFFSPFFFEAAEKVAPYFVSTQGAVAEAMLPKVFFEKYDEFKIVLKTKAEIKEEIKKVPEANTKHGEYVDSKDFRKNIISEKLGFQAPLSERTGFYRTYIREAFAKKQSVFMMLPNASDIAFWRKNIERGIENYVFVFETTMTPKELITKLSKMIEEPHPVIILGTASFLSVPRNDIQTIIIEHERSDSYKLQSRPFLDSRIFAESYACLSQKKIILADTFLRTETLLRKKAGELSEVAPFIFAIDAREKVSIVDMKDDEKKLAKKTFKVLSPKTELLIEKTIHSGEHLFLFTLRKGLAPTTVCNDCKNPLLCTECRAPLVLYAKKSGDRLYVCPRCKEEQNSLTTCPSCKSWNLVPLGVGTERVYEEVRAKYPEADIILIDKETTKTKLQVEKALKAFLETKGSILIGTELALNHLKVQVERSAVVSLDTLWSIPSFEISEKIVGLLSDILEKTEREFVIQTRNPEEKILTYFMHNTLSVFYKEELTERKTFEYPPFIRFLKVKAPLGTRGTQVKELLEELFAEYSPYFVSSFSPKTKERTYAMIIKIPRELWGTSELSPSSILDKTLLQKLSELPESYTIEVSPQSLFA